ncbi:MAG TPA: IS5 family transposase [Actinomycetota bacterium]|nr:IS5 family transposase [Actinomycetota bacterium]
MTTTIDDLVPDPLWQAIQPLLPTPPPRYGGRPRIDDRAALAGIIYQLRTGIPWRLLPTRELGCGSPVTCWRRLRDWQRAGVWQQLHHLLVEELSRQGRLDWSRASLDSLSVRAKAGGCLTGPNPTDRGKPGSKYHPLVDRGGIPLAVGLSAANTHDSLLLEPMVDAVPAVKGPRGRPGRPRRRPAKLHGDKGYDHLRCRRALRRRGITPRIARRGIESSGKLGRHRYVVERSLAWLVGYRRLQVRYERRADILLGFLYLACALICFNSLNQSNA